MDGKVLDCLLNPIRMRILQLFLEHNTETVKRIAEELPDVPPASLYRHVNRLVEDQLLEVCAEYKIRGTVEKVYRLKDNPLLMALLKDFNYYFREGHDVRQERVEFESTPLYLSDGECEVLVENIKNVVEQYVHNDPSEERRLRQVSFFYNA